MNWPCYLGYGHEWQYQQTERWCYQCGRRECWSRALMRWIGTKEGAK